MLFEPDTNRLSATDTAALAKDQRNWIDETAGIVTSWADFDRIEWPCAGETDLYILEYAAKHLPEGMGILVAMYETGYELDWT